MGEAKLRGSFEQRKKEAQEFITLVSKKDAMIFLKNINVNPDNIDPKHLESSHFFIIKKNDEEAIAVLYDFFRQSKNVVNSTMAILSSKTTSISFTKSIQNRHKKLNKMVLDSVQVVIERH